IRRIAPWAIAGGAVLVAALQLPTFATAPGPNGKIAFSSNRNGNRFHIYAMAADGKGTKQLTTNENGDDTEPDWTTATPPNTSQLAPLINALPPALVPPPPTNRIVFVSTRAGREDIYTMDADGSNETRLTNAFPSNTQPRWSADGGSIAFTSLRDRNPEIY